MKHPITTGFVRIIVGGNRNRSAGAIRPAMTYNHNETLVPAPGVRFGLKLSNHNETLVAAPAVRFGVDLGNHNENLVADHVRLGRTPNHNETLVGHSSVRFGVDLKNHNETLVADARAR